MVAAARTGSTVELTIDSGQPIAGVPVLPVAAQHVSLVDGRVISLPAVRMAEIVRFPDPPEGVNDGAHLTDVLHRIARVLEIPDYVIEVRLRRAIAAFESRGREEPF